MIKDDSTNLFRDELVLIPAVGTETFPLPLYGAAVLYGDYDGDGKSKIAVFDHQRKKERLNIG